MINLGNFVEEHYMFEGSKNKPKGEEETIDAKDVDVKALKARMHDKKVSSAQAAINAEGKDAEHNGSAGIWDVDSPTAADKPITEEELDDLSDNNYALWERFEGKGSDFLVLGDAGWAKTEIITSMAKRSGRHVITVYLDKATPQDLGGVTVPAEHKSGRTKADVAVPGWIIVMLDNPDKKYLLFFDEMNQADPDVMNALMPIVLKHTVCGINFHDQFMVGAAGNERKQNSAVNDLNEPLEDRFKPIIHWESHTDSEWAGAFKWAHEHYDDKIGAEIINETEKLKQYWNSPRDLTRQLYDWLDTMMHSAGAKHLRPKFVKERFLQMVWRELDEDVRGSHKFEADINKFIDYVVKYCANGGPDTSASTRRARGASSKDNEQVEEIAKENLIKALMNGFIFGRDAGVDDPALENKKFYVTKENAIADVFDPAITGINAEIFKRILKEMEQDGQKVKYNTNAEAEKEAKANNLLNPAE